MGVKYRPNVAGILCDGNGKILVGERLKHEGAWQFPQGGVDEGEDDMAKRDSKEQESIRHKSTPTKKFTVLFHDRSSVSKD